MKCNIVLDKSNNFSCRICKREISPDDWYNKNIPECGSILQKRSFMKLPSNSGVGSRLEEIIMHKVHKKITCQACRAEVLNMNNKGYKEILKDKSQYANSIYNRGRALLGNYNPLKLISGLLPEFTKGQIEKWISQAVYDKFSMNFVRSDNQFIGHNFHRSGWDMCMKLMYEQLHNSTSPILFDDFIEQTFLYTKCETVYRRPWIGVFHHPVRAVEWWSRYDFEDLWTRRAFQESLPYLETIVTLSEDLGKQLSERFNKPYLALKYITYDTNVPQWSLERWNDTKQVLQVGWYLRNINILRQIPLDGFCGVQILNTRNHPDYQLECVRANPVRFENVLIHHDYVDNAVYDDLLAGSVVVSEIFEGSANSVVVECIARNTPHIVNRRSFLEEYLGRDYPLFYENKEEIHGILCDTERILRGHKYLEQMDKSWMSIDYFIQSLRDCYLSTN